jgi:carbamoyl-phosphate synthase small subunit
MTGYQEILTDPSYKSQVVVMTYPMIGNYGINADDMESYCPHVSGLVIRELSPIVSNWRSKSNLSDYLSENNIPGIQGIDTRSLTRRLRVRGSLKGVISTDGIPESEALRLARDWPGLEGVDYVRKVTHNEPFNWTESKVSSKAFQLENHSTTVLHDPELPAAEIPIVAYDFGIKYNILRRLRQCGFDVQVVPAGMPAEEALKFKPAGIFLSNGPGDPAAIGYAVRAVEELIQSGLPVFGICLGHQVLCQALGAKTYKLKFGHRGANHPVKNLRTGGIEITSQNHGFAVDPASIPNSVEVDRINLNDQTIEGIRHKTKDIFCVQYHPEASPGPNDASSMFEEFRKRIDGTE